MIEDGKSEILRLPLPPEIKENLKGLPLKVFLALSQQFTPEYRENPDKGGWSICHYEDDRDGYILIEHSTDDTLFDIAITKTNSGKEVRVITIIVDRQREVLGEYLFDLENTSIQFLAQNPNVVQP